MDVCVFEIFLKDGGLVLESYDYECLSVVRVLEE